MLTFKKYLAISALSLTMFSQINAGLGEILALTGLLSISAGDRVVTELKEKKARKYAELEREVRVYKTEKRILESIDDAACRQCVQKYFNATNHWPSTEIQLKVAQGEVLSDHRAIDMSAPFTLEVPIKHLTEVFITAGIVTWYDFPECNHQRQMLTAERMGGKLGDGLRALLEKSCSKSIDSKGFHTLSM